LKPAFSKRSFAECTAWNGVGESLRKETKSFARSSEALPAILPKLLFCVVVFEVARANCCIDTRAEVGVAQRAGIFMEGGYDDESSNAAFGEVESFGSRVRLWFNTEAKPLSTSDKHLFAVRPVFALRWT
jgi:hypothetical protein